MKNADLPANPTIYADMGHNGQREIYCDQTGLTKREMFAMAAMQGMLSNPTLGYDVGCSTVAECATGYADALLAELERTK